MLKDLSNSNIEIWQIKEMLIILTLFGLLLTVVFKNLLRHTCVSISNVTIRSETSRIFSLSESTNAQSLLCNDIMDPDCFEKWRSLLLIRVTTISVWGFTVCNGCCTDLSRFAMSSGHPHKGPVFWSVVHSVTKEYTSHQSKHSFIQFSSVQLLSVRLCIPMDCSTPGLPVQHAPRAYPNSYPLSWWCHPTISSSVVPFSSCPQSFPTSWSFQMSQLFASGGQILEFQLQHQSFQWTPRTDVL